MHLRTISGETLISPGHSRVPSTLTSRTSRRVVIRSNSILNTYPEVRPSLPEPVLHPDQYSQMLSALAHEVRNPLTNINLSVDMLLADLKDDDQKIYLDIISRNSTRINILLTQLLKYQETIKVVAERHSIHQLLEEVLDIAKDRIILKNTVISKDFATGDFYTMFNATEVKIALTNIVINALEAMSPGKGELKLITRPINGKCQLRIEDNGCGISREKLKNIFKPFVTSRPGGLGLGLSTADNALRLNRIAVHVESEEGVGTSFILLFDQDLTK